MKPRGAGQAVAPIVGQHLGEVVIELAPAEDRTVSAATVASKWRELTGEIPDAVELTFSGDLFSAGAAVNVQLAGPRIEELRVVADELKRRLSEFPLRHQAGHTYRQVRPFASTGGPIGLRTLIGIAESRGLTAKASYRAI